MAKVQRGNLVGQISGAVGAIVHSRNRYGAYIRGRVHPTIATSGIALQTKARLSMTSQEWADLLEPTKKMWGTWAANNPITDRLGEKQVLAGNAAYIKLNALWRLIVGTQMLTPPSGNGPAPLTGMSLTGDIGAGTTLISFDPMPLGATERLAFRAAVTEGAGKRYVKNLLKLCGWSSPAPAAGYDYQSETEARFGTLKVGQYVTIEAFVYDSGSGLWSLPLSARVVITST